MNRSDPTGLDDCDFYDTFCDQTDSIDADPAWVDPAEAAAVAVNFNNYMGSGCSYEEISAFGSSSIPYHCAGGGTTGAGLGVEITGFVNPCPLFGITGDYTVENSNTDAIFAPAMALDLDSAIATLNAEGIVPEITTGFRTINYNARVGGAANSNHLVGLAVDINTKDGNFTQILDAMKGAGLTWGGQYVQKENHHFQLPNWGSNPSPAQIQACSAEHPTGRY